MKALVLRFDAPMMSFGGVIVDQHGFTHRFPGISMLTGLIANALGWDHRQFQELTTLQNRIEFAARWDIRPRIQVDYQTVDLGQPKMLGHADRDQRGNVIGGWTTRGQPEHRAGGTSAKFGTHERFRHYLVDGLLTVVMTLTDGGIPDLAMIEQALRRPARPLFLGRKSCMPSRPLLDPKTPVIEGANVLALLTCVPVWDRTGKEINSEGQLLACWPARLANSTGAEIKRVYDLRDWTSQVPSGSRLCAEGLIKVDQI